MEEQWLGGLDELIAVGAVKGVSSEPILRVGGLEVSGVPSPQPDRFIRALLTLIKEAGALFIFDIGEAEEGNVLEEDLGAGAEPHGEENVHEDGLHFVAKAPTDYCVIVDSKLSEDIGLELIQVYFQLIVVNIRKVEKRLEQSLSRDVGLQLYFPVLDVLSRHVFRFILLLELPAKRKGRLQGIYTPTVSRLSLEYTLVATRTRIRAPLCLLQDRFPSIGEGSIS